MGLLALSFSERMNGYLRFYRNAALDAWNNMTPMEYGFVLIGIGVFGYLLMKSSIGTK